MDLPHALPTFCAAFLAGTINSVAGGGTLLSFPSLIWAGLDSVTANATSTIAIWPGTVASSWGYRRELRSVPRRFLALALPSLVGGILGAILLGRTPTAAFDRLVPYLILFATLLFTVQDTVQRWVGGGSPETPRSATWLAGAAAFQFVVGLYGGYFGAGCGILMLAAFSILGVGDIHQMNGLKVVLASALNGVAALYFVLAGMVYWPYVALMAVGAAAGGWGGAGLARRLGRQTVRKIVVVIGFGLAISFFFKR